MKGLAFNVIAYVIIALIGVALLLLIITGSLQTAAKNAYCSAYGGIVLILPAPEGGEPTVPAFCVYDQTVEDVVIREGDVVTVSRKIAGYAIACLKKTETLNLDGNVTCYDIVMQNVTDVGEENVTTILINEGGCEVLQNSDFGCGSRDQLIWNVDGGRITNQRLILIEYNSNNNTVEVIA